MIERRLPEESGRSTLPVLHIAEWHEVVETALRHHAHRPGPLLLVLQDVQRELRHIPPDSIQVIADALNLTRAEVHGVVSFYHDFRESPSGRHTLRICRAESCQALGAEGMLEFAKEHLGVELGGTTADGSITLQAVYCLGNCALSPAVAVDGEVFGRVSQRKLVALIEAARDTGAEEVQ